MTLFCETLYYRQFTAIVNALILPLSHDQSRFIEILRPKNFKVYPLTLLACLGMLVLCWLLRASSLSATLPYVQAGTFVLLSMLAVKQPFWGLVAALSSLPVTLVIPGFLFGISYLPILGIATAIGYLVRVMADKNKKQIFLAVHFVGFLFVLWIVVSNPLAAFWLTHRTWVLVFVQALGTMFLATQLVRTVEEHRHLMMAFVISSFVSALFAIYQVHYGADAPASVRGYGLTQGPNGASRVYLASIIFLFFLYANHRKASYRWLMYLSCVVFMTGIASTISRHGILLTFAFAALLVFLPIASVTARAKKFVILLAAALLIVVPFQYFKIISAIPESLLVGTDSVGFRYAQWRVAIDIWKEHFWSGIGVGQFASITHFYGKHELPYYGIPYGAHNMFLSVLSENGTIGFVLFMTLLVWFAIVHVQRLKLTASQADLLHIAWLAVFFVIVLSGFSGDWQPNPLLWFIMGLQRPIDESGQQQKSPHDSVQALE